jgi:hypothetical protein
MTLAVSADTLHTLPPIWCATVKPYEVICSFFLFFKKSNLILPSHKIEDDDLYG